MLSLHSLRHSHLGCPLPPCIVLQVGFSEPKGGGLQRERLPSHSVVHTDGPWVSRLPPAWLCVHLEEVYTSGTFMVTSWLLVCSYHCMVASAPWSYHPVRAETYGTKNEDCSNFQNKTGMNEVEVWEAFPYLYWWPQATPTPKICWSRGKCQHIPSPGLDLGPHSPEQGVPASCLQTWLADSPVTASWFAVLALHALPCIVSSSGWFSIHYCNRCLLSMYCRAGTANAEGKEHFLYSDEVRSVPLGVHMWPAAYVLVWLGSQLRDSAQANREREVWDPHPVGGPQWTPCY